MTTAKRRAIDVLRRERTARTFAPELERRFQSEWTLVPTVDEMFGANAIKDDQLRMMFSCCHPRLPEQAQVMLVLHLLCGFSVNEISSAFLTGPAAAEKRITRAKKVLAGSKKLFDLAHRDFAARLSAVHRALYLLFNEGYHGASPESAVRAELCREAMRLAAFLLDQPLATTPATYALCALMYLQAARLPARVDPSGNLSSLFDQDRSRFDQTLAANGRRLLELSASGPELTGFHIEAAIAAEHVCAPRAQETNWARIVALYDKLMDIRPSPVVELNRAIAVGQLEGPERGLEAIRAIADSARLVSYPFYSAALGELELRNGRREIARDHFRAARALARNAMERRFLEQRVQACEYAAP
jgi:RNA polymerase sigma-70 factor (ECF subfamily)